jgi:hypothetical protein
VSSIFLRKQKSSSGFSISSLTRVIKHHGLPQIPVKDRGAAHWPLRVASQKPMVRPGAYHTAHTKAVFGRHHSNRELPSKSDKESGEN